MRRRAAALLKQVKVIGRKEAQGFGVEDDRRQWLRELNVLIDEYNELRGLIDMLADAGREYGACQ